MVLRPWFVPAFVLAFACGEDPATTDEDSGSGGIGVDGSGDDDTGPKLDLGSADTGTGGMMGGCAGDVGGCTGQVDLLFVIDNSGSMGEEQLNLAQNLPLLIQQLENLTNIDGNEVDLNVHIMVTTTDSGNPLCDPFYTEGRAPENGSPISSACTDRLGRFTSVDIPPIEMESVCSDICPNAVAPEGSFIRFDSSGSNVPDVEPVDINGDGVDDSALAQALACVGPQGIDGCGYERPLDSMRSALDSEAEWNQGSDSFLRSGGLLAVAIITDEADCSIANDSVMMDTSLYSTNPDNMMDLPTSALCWDAGVSCDGPDGDGVYSDCVSTGEDLTPVQDYIDLLEGLGRPVVMLGILGVPEVTAYAEDPPFNPIEGGVAALEYRDWRDPDWDNGGDILPDDWTAGRDAEFQEYRFGIGPGCTGITEDGGFTGQAIPPVRIKEVCQALDIADDPDTNEDESQVRCCIESICDTDFSNAIRCLGGLIETNYVPQG